jgi:sulfur-oxidizing protein SoxY
MIHREEATMDKLQGDLVIHRRALLAVAAAAATGAQAPVPQDSWPSLAPQIFGDRPIGDGGTVLAIDAPYRAEDAAVVPITIRSLLPMEDGREIRALTLVIDENPSPLAAVFKLGPSSGLRALSTRVRVDSYTNVTAVAELDDGRLYATQRFVKAAGGCSAPAARLEADATPAGTMRFRQFAAASGDEPGRGEAQLMIRHPNYSGMQMDQVTRLYVPARFVRSVRIWQGTEPLLTIEAGISISENPAFRFDYRPNGAATFRAEVEDSDGRIFHQEWAATAS